VQNLGDTPYLGEVTRTLIGMPNIRALTILLIRLRA